MKKLNLMFVTHEPPILGHGGSGNYLNMMLKFFISRGHKVSLFLVDWGFLDNEIINKTLHDLKRLGIDVNYVSFKKENFIKKIIKVFFLLIRPSNIYFKQSKYLQSELKSFHDKIKPDTFFLYCAQSLEWTKNLNEAKKFVL